MVLDRLIGTATAEVHFHVQSQKKSPWSELLLPSAECFLFILVWVDLAFVSLVGFWFGVVCCFVLFHCVFCVCFLHFAFLPINSNAYVKFILGKKERIQPCCKQHHLAPCWFPFPSWKCQFCCLCLQWQEQYFSNRMEDSSTNTNQKCESHFPWAIQILSYIPWGFPVGRQGEGL